MTNKLEQYIPDENGKRSLSSLIRFLVPHDKAALLLKTRSLDSLGVKANCVGDMGVDRRRQLAKILLELISIILTNGSLSTKNILNEPIGTSQVRRLTTGFAGNA